MLISEALSSDPSALYTSIAYYLCGIFLMDSVFVGLVSTYFYF